MSTSFVEYKLTCNFFLWRGISPISTTLFFGTNNVKVPVKGVRPKHFEVWALSKEFFRSYGFMIEKENQKIGLIETDYLEIETQVPDKSLGAIRAALSKALKTQYGLPIADKYRIRIEPTDNPMKSEVYLTLSSIGEVVSGATRVWQPREKDVELETEMLLKLMVFLGSDSQEAINKIQSDSNLDKGSAILAISESGFPELSLPLSLI